jgi:hypothetical protein
LQASKYYGDHLKEDEKGRSCTRMAKMR